MVISVWCYVCCNCFTIIFNCNNFCSLKLWRVTNQTVTYIKDVTFIICTTPSCHSCQLPYCLFAPQLPPTHQNETFLSSLQSEWIFCPGCHVWHTSLLYLFSCLCSLLSWWLLCSEVHLFLSFTCHLNKPCSTLNFPVGLQLPMGLYLQILSLLQILVISISKGHQHNTKKLWNLLNPTTIPNLGTELMKVPN